MQRCPGLIKLTKNTLYRQSDLENYAIREKEKNDASCTCLPEPRARKRWEPWEPRAMWEIINEPTSLKRRSRLKIIWQIKQPPKRHRTRRDQRPQPQELKQNETRSGWRIWPPDIGPLDTPPENFAHFCKELNESRGSDLKSRRAISEKNYIMTTIRQKFRRDPECTLNNIWMETGRRGYTRSENQGKERILEPCRYRSIRKTGDPANYQ